MVRIKLEALSEDCHHCQEATGSDYRVSIELLAKTQSVLTVGFVIGTAPFWQSDDHSTLLELKNDLRLININKFKIKFVTLNLCSLEISDRRRD